MTALEQAFLAADVPWHDDIVAHARFVPAIAADAALRIWHRPVLASAARQPVAGITLGSTVYLRDHDGLGDWTLVAHECAHVGQVLRTGTWRFLGQYGLHYARGRARGLVHHAAYLAIPDEVEARRVESAARSLGRPNSLLTPTP